MEKSLEEKLFNKKENGWKTVDTRKKEAIFNFSKDYMNFLNKAKTEREFIVEATKMAQANGYGRVAIDGDDWKATASTDIKKGDTVTIVTRESIILTVEPA